MKQLDLMSRLSIPGTSKMVLLVMDGVGGLPGSQGLTELEAAHTPNLDALAKKGSVGLSLPVRVGVIPGSGPGHLGLFGYEPTEWEIGRGVLEGLGINFPLGPDDLAARGNFATVDADGMIIDRRAGRIPTEEGSRIVEMLRGIELPGVEVFIEIVREYRFVLVLRGAGLYDGLTETDPQRTGVPCLPVEPLRPEAELAADLLNMWLRKAHALLADEPVVNSMILRGIAKVPPIPKMTDIYKLKMAAIATYPMYRGIGRLIGMDVLKTGNSIASEVATLRENWEAYDFFFFHVKKTDSYGEDGNFDAKVHVIEELDGVLPDILDLHPDVIAVTGDHSTPSALKAHSWHEVPILMWSQYMRPDDVDAFGERPCMRGGLGHIHHVDIIPLMMANALRFTKFGA
ncbi:MAG: 2,3-bisphosphoglycerate-independent phosphoglycerate mutase [Anaerolineae bacterium]|nr:2,3-bisphosphoglycerate-independent phosphoglycerate mutase [Anaerolineae bacterium]